MFMNAASAASDLNVDLVYQDITTGMSQLEQQMTTALNSIASNPQPSPQQLAVFQYQTNMWTNLIQMESSIFKVLGDTTKQVVTNMGT